MYAGSSLLLIAAGAILRYAVTATVSGIDLQTVGLVLMFVGIVGLVLALLEFAVFAPRRRTQRRDGEWRDPAADPELQNRARF